MLGDETHQGVVIMIRIKQTGTAENAGFQSMGNNHMRQIGEKTARALCGMYPMPKMGHEVIVAFKKDAVFPSFAHRLTVQNISGAYFVTSSSTEVDSWPSVFGVEVTT